MPATQFWSQVAGTERPDWADRVLVVLDLLDRRSGGRFGDLDADARLAVIESLLDDPDYVSFLSPPGGSDRAARAGGQAGGAPPAAEDAASGRSCATRPLGDGQPGHPGRPAQRSAAPQRPLGAAAAGGARCRWLRAAGATTAIAYASHPENVVPSSGQHQAGTCRMGTDPATSVTDSCGRAWGHPNLRVIDGSLHVTNGG
jgi:choline dehydrogenase-like flavoprotein